jgi:beta-lactam-binding protein with PASTA domain
VNLQNLITIYQSSGQALKAVPNVVNLTQAAAEQALVAADFDFVIELKDVDVNSGQVDKVLAQTPAANQQAPIGSEVVLTVGRATTVTTQTTPTTQTTTPTTPTSSSTSSTSGN